MKWKLYLVVARYFMFFAGLSLRRWNPRVIAVTGSVGKTTLLNLLELQLQKDAHYSHDANSIYGISFDILGLDGVRGSKLRWLWLFIAVPIRSVWFRHTEEFYVVEIDGERPKETELLAKWVEPEVTLWVSVGRSHASHFDQEVKDGKFKNVDEAILHEFSFLPRYTKGHVFYNNTQASIVRAMSTVDTESSGVGNDALTSYAVWPNKTVLTVHKTEYTFHQPMPEEVYIQLALLEKFADYLGESVVTDLSGYIQPPGRSNYFDGIKNTKLIDSSYNAHLISMKSIIDMYRHMKTAPKWIVIGDVIEQGESEADEHIALGKILAKANFDRYIVVGRRTEKYVYPELDPSKSVSFRQARHALEYLEEEISGGETILFKGSQYLEGVVERLLAQPSDVRRLPRQEPAAKKRRAKRGL